MTHHLTAAEKRIVLAAANGLTAPQTAKLHFVSTHTVKDHRKNIRRRFGIPPAPCSFTAVVAFAFRACLIETDEIQGGPTRGDPDEFSAYGTRGLPPPEESFAELRARAARIASEYRASKRPPV